MTPECMVTPLSERFRRQRWHIVFEVTDEPAPPESVIADCRAEATSKLLAQAGPGPVEEFRREIAEGDLWRKGDDMGDGHIAQDDSPSLVRYELVAQRWVAE